MCIAILTTPGKSLTAQVFDRCWNNNGHGVGFAYIDPNTKAVVIDKGWMVLEGARKRYFEISQRYGKDFPVLIHFRAATVGEKNTNNCHPFKVKDGAMIHNGTFWRDSTAVKSDSAMLAEVMHNQLTYENLKKHKEQFQEAFGYNRVVFLFKDGNFHIVSEHYNNIRGQFGQWKDGIWYSNGGWNGGYNAYYGDDEALRLRLQMEENRYYCRGTRGMYGTDY